MAKAKKARKIHGTGGAAKASGQMVVDTLSRIDESITRLEQARAERAKRYPFALGDRAYVPGLKWTQGVVNVPRFAGTAAPRPGINEQQYYLTWVDDAGVGADGWFTLSELRDANKAPDIFVPGDLFRGS
jgi:hypothetical protein